MRDTSVDRSRPTPFEVLNIRLGLSAAQHDALWLLACCEIEPAVARMAQALGTPETPDLTIPLWQRLVMSAGAGVLGSEAIDELCELGLIETVRDPRVPAYRRTVRANDRVVDLARGELGLDREIAKLCELIVVDEIAARGAEIPASILQAFDGAPALVVATGTEGSGRATLLAHAAGRSGVGVLRMRGTELARDAEKLARQLRAIARDCCVFGVVPLVEDVDAIGEHVQTFDRELLQKLAGPVLVTAATGQRWNVRRAVVTHRVATPSTMQRAAIWRKALPGCDGALVDEVATRYTTTPGTIVAAAAGAIARRGGDVTSVSAEDVHEGLRAHLDDRLGGLATRVSTTQRWGDLVLPSEQYEQIVELVARVRHRRKVLDDWGFADKVGRGLGLAVLLSGPPGTGKTMVAGLVARELGVDLYQVDLSRVVSKYIGETEKNLAVVFDAAESGHAILLFDEADSLFAKRSEVKSSNDRYANLEVNYLLQRIEQFGGISVLTTNHETALDEAFRRRLAIHIRFAAPDEDQREMLWRAMIPARAQVDHDLDFAALARELAMTGGYIRNATLRAAYLAADQGSSITMAHLWRAARAEYEAMGKLAIAAA